MKILMVSCSWRALGGVGALAGLLVLSGCLEERIVWSPDGDRAAVIAKDGLHFCDAEGRLTPLLLPQASMVAWLADSRRLVVTRANSVNSWADLARVLGPTRSAAVEEEAESVWRRIQGGAAWSELAKNLKDGKEPLTICLRDRHATDLRARLSDAEWKDLAGTTATVSDVTVARVDGDKLETGPRLYLGVGSVRALRPSPNGQAVAFTAEMKPEKEGLELRVAPLDGSAPSTVVARYVSAYPDWTPDGRAVLYFGSSEPGEDAIRLGVLMRREVLDAGGRVRLADKPSYLAGALFNELTRVRCLPDGRILFNAVEIRLPIAADDYDDRREQLFALDPARQPTLVRLVPRKSEADLPEQLAFFEVSPDERQVVFGSTKGDVCLLTLATGRVERIQSAGGDSLQGAPVWRKSGEFTYVRRAKAVPGGKSARTAEIILRRGDQETVLSRTWSDEMVKGITE